MVKPTEATAPAAPTALTASALDRFPGIWLGLVPLLLLSWSQWAIPPLASAGDYAHYLLHALALAEGRPYADTGYLYSPLAWGVGPALQPPVWPLILTPVVKFFAPLGPAPRLVAALAMGAFLVIAGLQLARREGRALAVISCLIVGVAMENAYVLTAPLSDLPFAAFFWLAIAVGDAREEWSWTRLAGLGAIVVLATGTRVLGLALLPAILLSGLMRSGPTRKRVLILSGAGLVLALLALIILGDRLPFVDVLRRDGLPNLAESLTRVASYKFALFELTLYPTQNDAVNDGYHVAATGLLVVGLVTMARKHARSMLGASVVCYGTLLLVAPLADSRYSWPLWPVATAALVVGLGRVLSWLRVSARLNRPVACGLLFVIACVTAWRYGHRPPPASFADDRKTQELFAWFAAQPGRDSIRAVFGSPRVFALYTRIPSMGSFTDRSPAETAQELDRLRITHVVSGLGPLGPGKAWVSRTVSKFDPPWGPVFDNGTYRVLRRPAPGVTQ